MQAAGDFASASQTGISSEMTLVTRTILIVPVFLALAGLLCKPVQAQTYLTQTAYLNHPMDGAVYVGCDSQHMRSSGHTVTLASGGSIANFVTILGSNVFHLNGGDIQGSLIANNSSQIGVRSGFLEGGLTASDDSKVCIHGGTINNNMLSVHSGTIDMAGGKVNGNVICHDKSRVTITGGIIGEDILICDNSTVTLRGGGFGHCISLSRNATIAIYGHGCRIAPACHDDFNGLYSSYRLSGVLSDGTSLAGKILRVRHGSHTCFRFHNVPTVAPAVIRYDGSDTSFVRSFHVHQTHSHSMTALLGISMACVVFVLRWWRWRP
jgi:hypothetical protein